MYIFSTTLIATCMYSVKMKSMNLIPSKNKLPNMAGGQKLHDGATTETVERLKKRKKQ